MISEMFLKIATDLNIPKADFETDDSYTRRLICSALGYWCLSLVSFEKEASKQFITKRLKELSATYIEVFPSLRNYFVGKDGQFVDMKYLRETYEKAGYFIVNENTNYIELAPYERGIKSRDNFLLFGLPTSNFVMSGLGVYCSKSEYESDWKEVLIRDSLSWKEFIECEFCEDSFESIRDTEGAEFFDPFSKTILSKSWSSTPKTDRTIMRLNNDYYKIVCTNDGLLYAQLPLESTSDSFVGKEYRRFCYALKAFYENPAKCVITDHDSQYIKFYLNSRLPTREQTLLALIAWPISNIEFSTENIIRKSDLSLLKDVLSNLGIVLAKRS